MTEMAGACDSSDFDGNTTLVGSDDYKYIIISGFEIIKFSKEDKILDFISFTGNNMISTAIAAQENYTYF